MHWTLEDVWALDEDYRQVLYELIKSGDIRPLAL